MIEDNRDGDRKDAEEFFITKNATPSREESLAQGGELPSSLRLQRIKQKMIDRYSKPFLISDLLEEPYLSYLTQLEDLSLAEIETQFKPKDVHQFDDLNAGGQTGESIGTFINTNNLPKDENLKKLAIEKRLLDKLGTCNFDIDINENTQFETSKISSLLEKVKLSKNGLPNTVEVELTTVSESIDKMFDNFEDYYAKNEKMDLQKFINEFKEKSVVNTENQDGLSSQIHDATIKDIASFQEAKPKIDFEALQKELSEIDNKLDSLGKDLNSQVKQFEFIVEMQEKGIESDIDAGMDTNGNAPIIIGGNN